MKTKKNKSDYLAEMLTGEKMAIKGIGKFVISPRQQKIKGMPLIMIIGAAVFPIGEKLVLPENETHSEMWECELIIIPKRKYSGKRKNERWHAFEAMRADQVLSSNFGDPESWGKKYFG